jgi:hypothetical protein
MLLRLGPGLGNWITAVTDLSVDRWIRPSVCKSAYSVPLVRNSQLVMDVPIEIHVSLFRCRLTVRRWSIDKVACAEQVRTRQQQQQRAYVVLAGMGKQTKKGPLRCNAKSNPDPDTNDDLHLPVPSLARRSYSRSLSPIWTSN